MLRRAADYGLGKPPREMLFTVSNPESKFKSKSLIDTVLQRGADSVAQWLYVLIAGIGLVGHRVVVRRAVRRCSWRRRARSARRSKRASSPEQQR